MTQEYERSPFTLRGRCERSAVEIGMGMMIFSWRTVMGGVQCMLTEDTTVADEFVDVKKRIEF